MWKLVRTSWRSVLSVIIAYVITVYLFVYEADWLNTFVTWGAHLRIWLKDFVGQFSDRGETLFTFTVSDFTAFMTLMIIFVRVVVITLALGIGNFVVRRVFGRG